MPGTREIKRRIKSIGSTKKITRAMQMVSAAKMRKAQAAAQAGRSYSDLAWQIIQNLSDKVDPQYHSLLQANQKNKKVAVVLISSNRGLIGGFNTNLVNAVARYLKEHGQHGELVAEIVAIGKKGRDAIVKTHNKLAAEFPKQDRHIPISEVLPMAKLITDEYVAGKYGQIIIAYTHFVSTISQKPVIKQLLPLTGFTGPLHYDLKKGVSQKKYEYQFEPDPQAVLDYLLPRIIESQIYQAILESDASEHSARMVMMKNATEAADDLITDLTLAFNQLRQANITKELAEITAGRIAIE